MKMTKEIIELSPYDVCPFCKEFVAREDGYICKINCFKSKRLKDLWEDCPFLEKKYLVREFMDGMV